LDGHLVLVLRESSNLALQAVLAGEADAAAVDAVSLALFEAGEGRLITVGGPLQSEPYVIVVPANAPKLLEAVNKALAELAADGTLAAIKARWLEGDGTP
jgi:ABC-type amino acid transport substrate-binding protein